MIGEMLNINCTEIVEICQVNKDEIKENIIWRAGLRLNTSKKENFHISKKTLEHISYMI